MLYNANYGSYKEDFKPFAVHWSRGVGLTGGSGCTREAAPAAALPVELSSPLNPVTLRT